MSGEDPKSPEPAAPATDAAEAASAPRSAVPLGYAGSSQVVSEGGREPERLAIVAKARALQNHKGGPVMKPGDPIDDCITSWLAKRVAADRCQASTQFRLQTVK